MLTATIRDLELTATSVVSIMAHVTPTIHGIDSRGISTLKSVPVRSGRMSLEKDVDCPSCGETLSFYRTAAMTLHLGEKTKWRCPECGYGYVEINGIDTLTA